MVENGGCAIKFYRTEMTISLFFVLQELLFFNPFQFQIWKLKCGGCAEKFDENKRDDPSVDC
jgi:hypothetical protein